MKGLFDSITTQNAEIRTIANSLLLLFPYHLPRYRGRATFLKEENDDRTDFLDSLD